MDDAKEYLKIAIKYRFWILLGIAALMPVIAYFVAAGSIEAATTTKTAAIKAADSGVKPFQNGVQPNPKWAELTQTKTQIVADDVNKSWRKLYARQAPLLDWPKEVEEDFKKWGENWPKDVDPNHIHLVINAYVQVYPDFVTNVYKSFKPWDPETGEGIVLAPPEKILLLPASFSVNNPPALGKVLIAQKRLWIQRTLLDVIRSVNERAEATNWDKAWVKKITALEVASAVAQDQKSAAGGKELITPDEPKNPNAAAAADSTSGSTTSGGGDTGSRNQFGGPAGGFGGMGGGASNAPDTVEFIKADSDKFDIVPVALGLLVDQAHIPDLLIEFENSPMSIQVVEVDWQRPMERVTKPIKGETLGSEGFGQVGGRGMMLGMGAIGRSGRMNMGMMPGGNSIGNDDPLKSGRGNMMFGMGGNQGGTSTPKGKSRTEEIEKKEREKKEKAKKKDGDEKKKDEATNTNTIADPYYNIVEVRIYGQARFYKRPPEEAAPPPSPGSTPNAETAKDQPAAETKKEDGKAETAKTDGDTKKDATKAEDAKKDEPKKDAADAKKDDSKKDDSKKDDPQADAKKDASKDEAKKDEAKKDDSKKDEPKKDAAPPDASKDQLKAKDGGTTR